MRSLPQQACTSQTLLSYKDCLPVLSREKPRPTCLRILLSILNPLDPLAIYQTALRTGLPLFTLTRRIPCLHLVRRGQNLRHRV